MRGGITSLDMSVLLDGNAAKGREKREKPGLEKEFFLFEEKDLEENRQDSERSPAEQEERWKGFGDFFAKPNSQTTHVQSNRFGSGVESKTEGRPGTANNGKYIPPLQMANIQRSNDIYERYKAGEEWLMSEGGDDLAKGMINNFRSSIGRLVEDTAYLINDYAPWYKPAQKVISDNTAGNIKNTAEKQFENAKKNTGEVGDKLIDAADSFSESMGYSLFGLNAGTYLEAAGESTKEYRQLRESGYSEEEALRMAMGKAMIAVLSAKADDYVGKNNPVDDVLYGKNGLVDKIDDINYNNNSEKQLQNKLDYVINGEKEFIPEGTKFETVKTIAGNGSNTPINDIKRLVASYGGKESDWKKQAGRIQSEKYYFDIHWYELDSGQYDVKLKYRGNNKSNEVKK